MLWEPTSSLPSRKGVGIQACQCSTSNPLGSTGTKVKTSSRGAWNGVVALELIWLRAQMEAHTSSQLRVFSFGMLRGGEQMPVHGDCCPCAFFPLPCTCVPEVSVW